MPVMPAAAVNFRGKREEPVRGRVGLRRKRVRIRAMSGCRKYLPAPGIRKRRRIPHQEPDCRPDQMHMTSSPGSQGLRRFAPVAPPTHQAARPHHAPANRHAAMRASGRHAARPAAARSARRAAIWHAGLNAAGRSCPEVVAYNGRLKQSAADCAISRRHAPRYTRRAP